MPRLRKKQIAFGLCSFLAAFNPNAVAGDKFRLVRPPSPDRIPDLSFDEPEVMAAGGAESAEGGAITLRISGDYREPNRSGLFCDGAPAAIDNDGHLTCTVSFDPSQGGLSVEWVTVDRYGRTLSEVDQLAPGEFPGGRAGKPWGGFAGLTLTELGYHESGVPDYSEAAPRLEAGARRAYGERWDFEVGGAITLFPLAQSAPAAARFFELDGLAAYSVHPALSLLGGFYYETMIVNSALFGFQNQSGALIGVEYAFYGAPRGADARALLLIGPGFFGGASANYEISLRGRYGVGWLGEDRDLMLTLGVDHLALLIDGVTINATSFSIGAQFGL